MEGFTGKAPLGRAMESMAASWMELPKTASGACRRRDADAAEGFDFVFVGGDVDEAVGDEAGGVDLYAGGEDVVGGDVEAADAFFDDPVVGGGDGPDVAAVVLELGDEDGEFGEDVGLDVVAEEAGRRRCGGFRRGGRGRR